ncbi:hypothetical protein VNO77_02977 [Canavalia gladiata]|uniref:Uncharacterized protein n=1 Tax=Canavalia gladiata TaxID=3824 RepID=A0AAN9MVZ9_CANGL
MVLSKLEDIDLVQLNDIEPLWNSMLYRITFLEGRKHGSGATTVGSQEVRVTVPLSMNVVEQPIQVNTNSPADIRRKLAESFYIKYGASMMFKSGLTLNICIGA